MDTEDFDEPEADIAFGHRYGNTEGFPVDLTRIEVSPKEDYYLGVVPS